MHLCEFPPLSTSDKTWLPPLLTGDATLLSKLLEKADEVTIFKLGMACAERDIQEGVREAIRALKTQSKSHMVAVMAGYWLESSILLEKSNSINYLQALEINPGSKPLTNEAFMGGSFKGRRTSRIDTHLHNIKSWPSGLVEQFRSSGLMGSLLFRAIHHHPFDCTVSLLDHGASPNGVAEGYHPLWAALRAGKAPLLEVLLSRGASLEEAGIHAGKTLLVSAAERGLEPCVWALIEAGASPSDRSCGVDGSHAARVAGHVVLASKMEAFALSVSPLARKSGSSRRL